MSDLTSPQFLRPRIRLVGLAAVVGTVVGVVVTIGLFSTSGSRRFAASQSFAVGALLFGFALLGWSGSVMAGRGVENLQAHLDTNTDWTEADSRRAMARVGGFGAGWMVGSALAETLLLV